MSNEEFIGFADSSPIADEMQRRLQSRLRDICTVENRLAGYITEAKQAEKDGVSLATLRRRRARRYGPQPVAFGRKFYYREDATECWLAEQEAVAKAAREPPRRGRPRNSRPQI